MQDDLIGGAIVHARGSMRRPEGPELGIEIDQAAVDRSTIRRYVSPCLRAEFGLSWSGSSVRRSR